MSKPLERRLTAHAEYVAEFLPGASGCPGQLDAEPQCARRRGRQFAGDQDSLETSRAGRARSRGALPAIGRYVRHRVRRVLAQRVRALRDLVSAEALYQVADALG